MAKKSFEVDLTNYRNTFGERVKPDRYRVRVEDAQPTTAASGNPMVNLQLQITKGEYKGYTIIDRLVSTEKALFRVVNFLEALGYPTPRKKLNLNPEKWIGKTLDVDVADGKPYQGRVKSEVQGYMKAESSDSDSDDTDLDDLDNDDQNDSDTSAGDDSSDDLDVDTDTPEDDEETEPEVSKSSKKKKEESDDNDDDEIDLDEIDL